MNVYVLAVNCFPLSVQTSLKNLCNDYKISYSAAKYSLNNGVDYVSIDKVKVVVISKVEVQKIKGRGGFVKK